MRTSDLLLDTSLNALSLASVAALLNPAQAESPSKETLTNPFQATSRDAPDRLQSRHRLREM
jgi:hypothetical protein